MAKCYYRNIEDRIMILEKIKKKEILCKNFFFLKLLTLSYTGGYLLRIIPNI